MSKIALTIVLCLLVASLGSSILPVHAAVDSEEATESSIQTTPDATTKLRERLQKILGDQDEESGQTRAGYIGEVTRISDEAITLKTLAGSEIIPLEASTILLKRTQKIPTSEVAVGNWIIVIGQREKNRAIKPELLLVQTADLKPREHMVTIGDVSETTNSSITVIPRGKTEPITLVVNKNSLLTDAAGEKILPKNVPKDISVIVVGFATPNGWELGTFKTTVNLAEYKSTTSPSPSPVTTKKTTPRPATGSATTP